LSSSDLVERFAKRFAGLARAGGRYVVPDGAKPDAHGKILGRAWTAHVPATVENWEAHLSGKKITVKNEETGEPITGALGLGVVPIREDDTAVFGAIDVDVYPLDLKALVEKVRAFSMPVIVCRTKSGGAHIYLFLTSPARAELVRERLSEWAVALGYPGVEIFPKQSMISEHSDANGSWINLPYSGGNRSLRYGLKDDGSAMTVEEFLDAADRIAASPDEVDSFELPPDPIADDAFEEGPPCLQSLARTGFGEWGNNGLFNVAVYLKKRYGEGWEDHLESYNARFDGLGLGNRDVATIAKSVRKRDYFFKCKDQPIVSVCNKTTCARRAYGIGGGSGGSGVVIGALIKVMTDPVTWIVDVDGAEIELATEQLLDQRKFAAAIVEKASKLPNPVKPDEWAKGIRERLAKARVIEVPDDGSREGQLWAHLADFVTGRARGKLLEDVLRKVAFTDVVAKRVYFRSTDFFGYLGSHRFGAVSERDAWRWLRRRGAETHDLRLKGKLTTVWSVPAFPEQTEESTVPRGKPKEEM
jgi:hypothetical protein